MGTLVYFYRLILIQMCILSSVYGNNKVLLTNIKTLTLHEGAKTTGRRASSTSQLSRTGGSAPWGMEPRTVQCYNRGHDGVDVQWECKADLDSSVEFGRIEVTCEGYEYPDDPYILKGSCGLEYSLDYRKGGGQQSSYPNSYTSKKSSGFNFADMLVLAVIVLVAYAVYRTCTSSSGNQEDRAYSSTNDDYHGRGGGGGWSNPGSGGGGLFGSNLGNNDNPSCRRGGNTGGYGGFWSGLGMGGILGYMMNSGGQQRRNDNYYNRGGSYAPGGSFFSGNNSGSSGTTRPSSGFGGTRRR
ncbi:store-operated calcium entry-associated regulatory factor [Lepeophtheirus salmonis]|uniref:store-operated calcium entry-associated regulatory factor n=1 Tax=Lepeophtheirus salmonis TaxID=72036 RepID=UPI001AE3B5DD|nr:store-operated calcium entry-associated regulatory factor-like [Lepeophtheirus salmonis]